MAKNSQAGTDAQQVKQQNQASDGKSQQAGKFETEFGSETNAQQVHKQNQESQQKKGKNQQ